MCDEEDIYDKYEISHYVERSKLRKDSIFLTKQRIENEMKEKIRCPADEETKTQCARRLALRCIRASCSSALLEIDAAPAVLEHMGMQKVLDEHLPCPCPRGPHEDSDGPARSTLEH